MLTTECIIGIDLEGLDRDCCFAWLCGYISSIFKFCMRSFAILLIDMLFSFKLRHMY